MPADTKPYRPHRHLPKLIRIVRARPRLLFSAAIGLAVFAACPWHWRIATRVLIGWDTAVALYLILAMHMMSIADINLIRRRARRQDEGRFAILTLTAAAALASLGAIVALLGMAGAADRQPIQLLLGVATILLSWAFTHVMFALHYAYEFYEQDGGKGGGLTFPGEQRDPDYWDFVYFSFVIGMTNQVSDVAITSRRIRRTVSAHAITSFFFNVALLALTVNIAASAI